MKSMNKSWVCIFAVSAVLLTSCRAATVSEDITGNISNTQLSSQIASLQKSVDAMTSVSGNDIAAYETLREDVLITDVTQSASGLILNLTNQSDATFSEIKATVVYYGEDNNMLAYDMIYFNNVAPNTPYIQTCYLPAGKDGNPISFNHFEITYAGIIGVDIADNLCTKVDAVSNIGAEGNIIAKLTNKSAEELSSITATAIYYKEGEMIGSSSSTCFDVPVKEYGIVSLEPPYDSAMNPLEFDDYELLITEALPTDGTK